jgi:hypothetical protein
MKHNPDRDLHHFLSLARAQTAHRIREIETGKRERTATCTASRLRLLEELIKEQLPNEDTRHTARATR